MGSACNKKGGVCSIRTYLQSPTTNQVELIESPVSVCPNRFKENGMIYSWVGEVLLNCPNPIILGEIGFLDRFRTAQPTSQGEDESIDFIGRIDNVLIHPNRNPIDWCALEIQAVYFSGKSMAKEFMDIAESTGDIRFPKEQRRPDWRSSGPKRLLPQLQTKVPTIRTWGKKMAVVIDKPFFDQLVGIHAEPHLSNAEIIWFVVKYEETPTGWRLCRDHVVYTSLANSVTVLTGGTPLSKEAFESQLRQKLAMQLPNHPLAST